MDDAISKKTVLVLVLIAVIVSVLSTSLVIHSVYTTSPNSIANFGGGEVLGESNMGDAYSSKEPATSEATGVIELVVANT